MARPNSYQIYGESIIGDRSEQEDAFAIRRLEDPHHDLIVLADGMGGHVAGGVASKLAVEQFGESFELQINIGEDVPSALGMALEKANQRLAAWQETAPDTWGMGTTLVAAVMSEERLHWISVGDSVIWLWRNGRISRLNEDHSLRDAARTGHSALGNVLRSALTGQAIPLVDHRTEAFAIAETDLLLIASDGILTLDTSQIETTISSAMTRDPLMLTSLLMHAVQDKKKPRQDNCTLIIVAPVPATMTRPGTRFGLDRTLARMTYAFRRMTKPLKKRSS